MSSNRYFECQALILKVKPFGEIHKIVTMLSPEFGMIDAVAYGAQRPKSRFCSSIRLFHQLKAKLYKSPRNDFFKFEEILTVYSCPIIEK
ncbi:MAG: recombination protein O N-terminal domain-containing protein, partial [Spirochaetes bacterium]|nr:recombination protein O N-terminal domain-containing protein [Spirochaetota bacterium]